MALGTYRPLDPKTHSVAFVSGFYVLHPWGPLKDGEILSGSLMLESNLHDSLELWQELPRLNRAGRSCSLDTS